MNRVPPRPAASRTGVRRSADPRGFRGVFVLLAGLASALGACNAGATEAPAGSGGDRPRSGGVGVPVAGFRVRNAAPVTLTLRDFRDLPALAARLAHPFEAFSLYLRERLPTATRQALDELGTVTETPTPVRDRLIEALNEIIRGESIYQASRFAGIPLRPVTRELAVRASGVAEVRRLNRLLLEDALPDVLIPDATAAAGGPLRAFGEAELAGLLEPFRHRTLSDDDLERARQVLSQHYLSHGYLNSGAVLPDQVVTNGIVEFQIIEGELSEVHVHGNRSLPDRFLAERVFRRAPVPLNLGQLGDQLESLRRNPNLESLVADLQPVVRDGRAQPGESLLDLRVQEVPPWQVEFRVDNHRPASVGAEVLEIAGTHHNLTRHSDTLQVEYGILERSRGGGVDLSGPDNLSVSYEVPVTYGDLTVGAFYDQRSYAVIEEPLAEFLLDSNYRAGGVRLRQPLIRTLRETLSIGLSLERRHSESFLLGEPFGTSPGSVDGRTDVAVVRFGGDWTRSWPTDVLAARLAASVGVNALGATVGKGRRDAEFFGLLGQAQYLRRLGRLDAGSPRSELNLLLRASFQWTPDPLLSLEQFVIGGAGTVRGYRENQLVRDTGVLLSAELQLEVLRWRDGEVRLGPFVDFGAGWDVAEAGTPRSRGPDSLSSAGVGLEFRLGRHVNGRVDWGYAFRDTGVPPEDKDLQDLGIHFRVAASVF